MVLPAKWDGHGLPIEVNNIYLDWSMAFGGKGCCVERGQGQCWKRVIFNAETSVIIDIQRIVVFNAEARRGVPGRSTSLSLSKSTISAHCCPFMPDHSHL